MRLIEQDPRPRAPIRLTDAQKGVLEDRLRTEISDALSVRRPQERAWMEADRLYNGIPKNPMRVAPIEIPYTELTLGAIAVDSLYAQTLDLIWQPSPVLLVKPWDGARFQDTSEAVQTFANRMTHCELGLRDASNHAVLMDVKYGTGILYTPWVKKVRTTLTAKVVEQGPRTFAVPLEDFIIPGGATTMESAPWVCLRAWLSPADIIARARMFGWDVSNAQPTSQFSPVRRHREQLAGTSTPIDRRSDTFQIGMVLGAFDLGETGEEQDVRVYYDLTSHKVVHCEWNNYDRLPLSKMEFQMRENLFYGASAMDMAAPYQTSASEFLNEWLMNAKLANMRGFIGSPNQFPGDTVKMWPGRVLGVNDPQNFREFSLADAYASMPQAISMIVSFAERRTGVNEVSTPRPSAVLGNRTPGITALTLMQQVARRYTPAFDSARFAIADAAMQGLYRYSERLRQNDTKVEETIHKIMGAGAGLVIDALKDPDFAQQFSLQLAASSTTSNILQERQDAIAVAGLLGQYYEKAVQLTQLLHTQGALPPGARDVALQVSRAMGEVIERTVRKFDQVRDAEQLIIDMESAIDSIPNLPPAGVAGLLAAGGSPGAMGGGMPNGGPPVPGLQ